MPVEDWYLMNKPSRFNGHEADQFNNHAIEYFEQVLKNSPEAYDIKINGVDKRALIQFMSSTNATTSNIRKIVASIGELSIGDYIDHKSSTWLVTSLPDDDRMSQDAVMELCTNIIKWKDNNGNLIQYPCTVSKFRPFHVLMDKQTNINVPEGQLFVTAQYNADTVTIKHGKRFVFGMQSYEVSGIDDLTNCFNGKGCIIFTVKLVEQSIDDDVQNGVSNNNNNNSFDGSNYV